MKPYIVVQPFKDVNGSSLRIGDTIQCDDGRAAVLRRYGKITGVVETAERKLPKSAEIVVEAPVEYEKTTLGIESANYEKRGKGRR